MTDILPWLFLGLWVFAIVCCTELGWRIPVVRNLLFAVEEERRAIQKTIEEEMNERRK